MMRSFIICTLHQIELELSSQGGCDGRRHETRMGNMRSPNNVLVGKPEGK